MNCLDRETLLRYRDKELPEDQLRGVARHLDTCDSCRTSMNDLEGILKAIRGAVTSGDSACIKIPEFAPSESSAQGGRFVSPVRTAVSMTRQWLAAAAAVFVMAIGSLFVAWPVGVTTAEATEYPSILLQNPNVMWNQRQVLITVTTSEHKVTDRILTSIDGLHTVHERVNGAPATN
ncbi:MAG: zf-HC2 domain-containing protein [candidate division Zixibacteria bacterium]|nr:zf-HC2 domain-containing protein [candidate division Zixibacteria bacterium]